MFGLWEGAGGARHGQIEGWQWRCASGWCWHGMWKSGAGEDPSKVGSAGVAHDGRSSREDGLEVWVGIERGRVTE